MHAHKSAKKGVTPALPLSRRRRKEEEQRA